MKHLILAFFMALVPHSHHHQNHNFYRLSVCESSHRAHLNTGNGFYGAFQFNLPTWHGLGRMNLPSEYSYKSQRRTAIKLKHKRGWQPWPACSQQLGLG